MWRKTICGAGVSSVFISSLGCGGMKLETGYQYRPLNAGVAERRAYYASPFSPEKAAAEQEQRQAHKATVSPGP